MGTRHIERSFGINLAFVIAAVWLSKCDLNPQPLPPTSFDETGEDAAASPSGSGSSNSSSSGTGGGSGSSGIPAASGTGESGSDSGVVVKADAGSADGGAFTASGDAATDAALPSDASLPTDASRCASDAAECISDGGGDAVATD